ncbi:diacylglycerol kinase [Microbacterium mangrovi]|uniref:Diacylglycerol kinase n=1 Tax=Microbacterium mangrovi TaxID=1348253 RepID=A0A0B2A8C6_9MICO|nr:diacylglycerol kinase family protein [Microbacterium mangrovi]KHK98018.1 diacylglycerol kinase [Microbacterium mangrovi]
MRIAIVWNPAKTERDPLETALADVLDGKPAEVRWFETTEEDPGRGAAQAALAGEPDLLVVAGGDGTVRAVAEYLADSAADVELAILPLGTGNLLARNLDVPIEDVPAAFRQALDGEARPVDVGWVELTTDAGRERHGFVVMLGFGLDAQMIVETDEDLKERAGWLAYVESLGRALSGSDVVSFGLTVDDGHPQTVAGHTLLIGNCGALQGGVKLLPEADPGDGELDYLVLSAEGVAQWLGTVKKMVWDDGVKRLIGRGEQDADSESVRRGRASVVAVTLPEPRLLEVDGEELGQAREFTVTVQPAAMRVR